MLGGGRGLAFEFDDSKPCYLSIIEEYAFENIRSNYSHVVFSAYQMGAKFTQGKKGAACPLSAHATTRKVLLYLGCWSLDQFISPLHLLHRDFFSLPGAFAWEVPSLTTLCYAGSGAS